MRVVRKPNTLVLMANPSFERAPIQSPTPSASLRLHGSKCSTVQNAPESLCVLRASVVSKSGCLLGSDCTPRRGAYNPRSKRLARLS